MEPSRVGMSDSRMTEVWKNFGSTSFGQKQFVQKNIWLTLFSGDTAMVPLVENVSSCANQMSVGQMVFYQKMWSQNFLS
jgi:hypothetical protein